MRDSGIKSPCIGCKSMKRHYLCIPKCGKLAAFQDILYDMTILMSANSMTPGGGRSGENKRHNSHE